VQAGGGQHLEALAHPRQEGLLAHPAEVLHQPVVGEDLHLVVREDHRQEGVVLTAVAMGAL
jgi:hypothetical protein